MIHIHNINIAFDDVLLKDAQLHIPEGKLTVITGPSGIGKSSLLYVAGMILNHCTSAYMFNGHLVSQDNHETSIFRKKYIGYVFQDNSLIDHLSIYDNMQLYGQMASIKLSEDEARKILASVYLHQDLHQTTETLSGGEKQRLAIACAICKNPKLLILDEPTSALDQRNKQVIMDILKSLADTGMMILIASHDKDVISQCDVIYEIKQQKLMCTNAQHEEKHPKLVVEPQSLGIKFYWDYGYKYIKEHLTIHIILFIICGFSIALLLGSSSFYQAYERKQQMNMTTFARQEVLITSSVNENGEAKYESDLAPIQDIHIGKIKNNIYCKELYPYYEGKGNQLMIDHIQKELSFVVQPYPIERDMVTYCEVTSNTLNGAYLSSSLANLLEVTDITDQQITISMELPDGNEGIIQNMTISGIINHEITNAYASETPVLYVPIDSMPAMPTTQALIACVSSINGIAQFKEDILEINPEFGVYSPIVTTPLIETAIRSFKTIIILMMNMQLVITTILMFLVFLRYMGNRKKEICLLKVNGLSNRELIRLILMDMGIKAIAISVSAMIFILMIEKLSMEYLEINMSLSHINAYWSSIIYSFGLMVIPSLMSILSYQKYDPAVVLRNE